MTYSDFDILNTPIKGTNLIEASAGTGKTYTIAGLFLRLILDNKLMIEDILAVTFTEAATEELRYRARSMLRDALIALTRDDDLNPASGFPDALLVKHKNDEGAKYRLRYALRNFDEAAIHTIHGFCQRMLLENAFEISSLFNTELLVDESGLLQEIVDDFWRINFYRASKLFTQYAKLKSYSPEYFAGLLKKRSIDPSFEIAPHVERPDISNIIKDVRDAFRALQKKWISMKPDVENILFNYKGLNRKKYNLKSMPSMFLEMDDYLDLGEPLIIFKNFNKFTSSVISDSINKGFAPPYHAFFDLCEDFEIKYNHLRKTFDQYLLYLKRKLFEYSKHELALRKDERNIRSYDDLLENMHYALLSGSSTELERAVRKKFRAALIDEFQDTDPVQYNIFKTIFGSDNSIMCLIGDPKQSIYRFRGADIFAYMKASSNMRTRYTLRTNWRSVPELIRAVNIVFSRLRNSNPFIFKKIAFHEAEHSKKNNHELLRINGKDESPLHIWFINRDYADKEDGTINRGIAEIRVARAVASEIFRLISPGRNGKAKIGACSLKPENIAVLVRKNRQSRLVQQELVNLNIPSVLYGAESIFVSHEAREIQRIIAAIAEPGNEARIKTALATDIFGLSGDKLHELGNDELRWEDHLNRFHDYHDLWARYGFIRMFRSLMEHEGVRMRLISFSNGERRMTNLLHLSEVLHRAEVEQKLGMEGVLKWIMEKRIHVDESEENQVRLETDENAVNIVTIHKSKGLEYPVVFCPFAWDGSTIKNDLFTFHNPPNNNLTLDLGSMENENKKTAEKEELAENVRLLYVALTRAKHRCYIAWGKINQAETSALAYIFHSPGNIDPDNMVTELGNRVKTLSYDTMLNDIRDMENQAHGSIAVSNLPESQFDRYEPYDQTPEKLDYKQFQGSIPRDWLISSYSSLISDREYITNLPDHDSACNMPSLKDNEDEEYTMFNFPGGTKAGSCIHEIFENLNFTLSDPSTSNEMINEKLTGYGFDTRWQNVIYDMTNRTLSTPLKEDRPDFILKNIGNTDRLNELEFYFNHEQISPSGLAGIFSRPDAGNSSKNFAKRLNELGFKPTGGFVRGFIDMVFYSDDRYYIVDWKSNYLGPAIDDYSQERIESAMEEHYYFFQYHLYTVALHRYLSTRMPAYDYQKHFGGVFYIFVRGVQPEYGPSYGIYHDVPSYEFIIALDGYLAGNGKEIAS